MNALQLSKQFYLELGEPLLRDQCPQVFDRCAVGLCGRGSQCLAFDDELSRDHGWGAEFLVFLTDKDLRRYGEEVNQALADLPMNYHGFENRQRPAKAVAISEWFPWCLEAAIPVEPTDWLNIAEYRLLEATNGEIWCDPLGEVTAVRHQLGYYPEEIWRSRLASKLWQIADSGAYNFPRAEQRGDPVTSSLALSRFLQQAMELCFLLNRAYAPYYKWLHAGFTRLPSVAKEQRNDIASLSQANSSPERRDAVFRLLSAFRKEIQRRFPETASVEPRDDFFDYWDLSRLLRKGISNDQIREATLLKP